MIISVTDANREAYRVAFPHSRTRVRSHLLTLGLWPRGWIVIRGLYESTVSFKPNAVIHCAGPIAREVLQRCGHSPQGPAGGDAAADRRALSREDRAEPQVFSAARSD